VKFSTLLSQGAEPLDVFWLTGQSRMPVSLQTMVLILIKLGDILFFYKLSAGQKFTVGVKF
jgi:hypothetical protein